MNITKIATLGELKASGYKSKTIKEELRDNLIAKLKNGKETFPGIIGYDETVIPDVERALLSKHNILFLGLRGQAKTRMARLMTELMDEYIPAIAGSELNDDPLNPVSKYAIEEIATHGDETPIHWIHRSERYGEKLATPDVSVADLIGDIDPIKAANLKLSFADERVIHYGIIPRSNRSIFVINELPDLQARIQVALFNILEEGDIQIRGFKLRLKLDILFVFTANPEDYTNRGSIVTPLKDRIESQILTHYPKDLDTALAITEQEAWLDRPSPIEVRVPDYIRRVVEQLAFLAREDKRVDKRSGVSQRLPISVLENVVSNAERRALKCKDDAAVPRVTDIYSALPAITGKLELEYEGELKGGDTVARELIRTAVGKIYNEFFEGVNFSQVINWFDIGGSLKLDEGVDSATMVRQLDAIQGLMEKTKALGLTENEPDAVRAAAAEFILEGLHAHRRISRNEERGFSAEDRPRPREPRERDREEGREGKGERPNSRRGYN